MFIAVVIAIAVLIALVRGGNLANLANIEFRWFYLLFIPLLLQLLIFTPLASYLPGGMTPGIIIYLSSMMIGAVVVWQNRRLPGFPLLLAGLLANTLVIVANGGQMPVLATAREIAGMPPLSGPDNNVMPLSDTSLLWFLADILPTPKILPLANVYSVGDVLIAIGGVWFMTKVIGTKPQAAGAADAVSR
jgi:hypothetical protein